MTRLQLRGAVVFAVVATAYLQLVGADDGVQNPNVATPKEFNAILTSNGKDVDIACCMGVPYAYTETPQYWCAEYQVFATGNVPGARTVGNSYCFTLREVKPSDSIKVFQDLCVQQKGRVVSVHGDTCPNFDNYRSDYKPDPQPVPPPPSVDGTTSSPAVPAAAPPGSNKQTNSDSGFVTKGSFNYALVDYSITQSLGCCHKSSSPIVVPQNYKCQQRKVTNLKFLEQCAKIVSSVTHPQSLKGYSTVGSAKGDGSDQDPANMIVDDQTKATCQDWWTAASTYTYGHCRLDFETARDESLSAFKTDCESKAGRFKAPHNGHCLWVSDASSASSTTGTTT